MSHNSSFYDMWTQELKTEIWQLSERFITTWCDVVIKTGIEDRDRERWSATFKEQVEALYQDMIDDALVQQRKLIAKIEVLLKRAEELCKDLSIKMPKFGTESLSLSQEYVELATKVEEYEQILTTRKNEISKLTRKHEKLCTLLGVPNTLLIPESPLPSEEFLNGISSTIDVLENEKFLRTESFLETKSCIVEIADKLGYRPNLDFEKTVLTGDELTFLLTDTNMNHLKQFKCRLLQLYESTTDEIAKLGEQVTSMCEMLNEDINLYTEIKKKYSGKVLDVLEALKREMKRLEALKRANIEKFVKLLRVEMEQLWDQCHYTSKQRENFEYFNGDLYTEDLLTLHDLEIQRLKHHYDENKELFSYLEDRQKMWIKLGQLEERVTAPDRFKNRGGQLLKEEKERNALSRHIPLIEEQLFKLADVYKQRTGVPFTSWGNTIDTIIENDHRTREEEKHLKSSARKRNKTITPGKATTLTLSRAISNQNLATCASGNSGTKRKIFPTPEVVPKRLKTLSEYKHAPKTAPPRIVINSNKIKKKYRRLSRKLNLSKRKSSTESGEYNTFEREIENKENCRSTLFSEASSRSNDCASEAVPLPNTPIKPRTPFKRTLI